MRFLDTSFWYAVAHPGERNHAEAESIVRAGPGRLLTTNHVQGESWTLIRRRHGHRAAVAFLDRMGRVPDLTVAHVDADLEDEALRWLRRHDERECSFVDATSFAVMRGRRLREALAFDGDFSAAGFVEVRA